MTLSRGVQERAFAEALKAAPARPEDVAMVAATRRTARLIDLAVGEDGEGADVVKLLAEYRQQLAALGLTPQSRAQMTGKGGKAEPDKPKGALQRQRDELAERRAAREAGS